MPRRKLRELVQMLAYSIKILLLTVELDDQAKSKEHHKQTVALAIETSLNSANDVGEQDEAVDDD
jgi:hypothetical protein